MNTEQKTNPVARIAEALGQTDRLSSARCAELTQMGRERLAVVDERIALIRPTDHRQGAGRVRVDTLIQGDSAAVVALDNEHTGLCIERAQLDAQLGVLAERKQTAIDSEASEGLPQMQADLVAALSDAETALGALKGRLSKVNAAFIAIKHSRVIAERARLPAAVADPTTIQRIGALRADIEQSVKVHVLSRPLVDTGDDIGRPEPGKAAAQWAA